MKRNWESDELIEHFTFLPSELQQVGNKGSASIASIIESQVY
jgi:hypothetical protein